MKYYLIAGEASGDLHGSNLIKSITALDQNAIIRAWGGDKMEEAGAELARHYRDHNYMGFAEVVIHLRKILSNFRYCKADILKFRPDVLVLIDFPGFNLRIAQWAKKHDIKVAYYISPQIWAWKTSRVHTIKQVVDKMITILPFEQEFYARYDMKVDYVGHPLLDAISNPKITSEFHKKTIALLPGSRKQEISRMLPVMTSLIPLFTDYTFIIAGAHGMDMKIYQKYSSFPCEVRYNQLYDLLSQSAAAIVTSGTATLETALNNVPLVVCYKSSILSYHIAKQLIKVPYISLVNLIMNKKVVTELIQNNMNSQLLKEELNKILHNEIIKNRIFADYSELKTILGNSGASDRAAVLITGMTKETITG